MEKHQINQLIEKYFEGNTSLKEEKILREYLSQDEYNDWPELKKQFGYFKEAQELSLNTSRLESRIISSIEEFERQSSPPAKKRSITRYLVAATIAAAIIIAGIFIARSPDNRIRDTYTDPAIAYAETQKALLLVSQKMNQGIKPLNHINRLNTGTQQLKNLEKMDKSLEMLNLVSFINPSSNLKK